MRIKNETSEIQINILRRSNSDTEDFWDGNWIEAEIRIQVRGFNCVYGTNLRVDDFQRFNSEILMLMSGDKNEIEFLTMEEGFYLHLKAELNGAISITGKAKDDVGNSLGFKFEIHLMSLENFRGELLNFLKLYPIVGNI